MTPGKAAVVTGFLLGTWPAVVLAQIPGVGAGSVPGLGSAASGLGGAAGMGGAAGLAGAGGAAAPKGLCSGLKTCLAGCKQKICGSPLGSLINNGLAPYSTLSGGLIPQFCPTVPSDADVAALAAQGGPNSAGAVAAKVKQDEAEAKARRAAVRYLATVDCHYWPDAEVAIISALRDDRNECVRFEGALALLNGCCCNARTIEALNITVSGSEKDGKPSETSERVRSVALAALQGCLLKYEPEPAAPPEAPAPLEAPRPLSALDPSFRRVAYYYQTLPTRSTTEVVAGARATVTREKARFAALKTPRPAQPGERSVYHALARAGSAPAPATKAEGPIPAPPPEAEPVAIATPVPASIPAPVATAPSSTRPVAAPRGAATLEDRAVVPAGTQSGRPGPAHRGLFGIIRDSASPRPGNL